MMKLDDEVKVFVQVGLMKKPRWIKGKYIKKLDIESHLVKVANQEVVVGYGKIKSWVPLESKVVDDSEWRCEELDRFAKENWESLKEDCQNALAKFFPDCYFSSNEEEKTLYVYGEGLPEINISPGIEEVESIARFFEVPAWSVTYFVEIPATYHEPPDADEIHCGHARNSTFAIKILIDTIWKLKTDDYWESLHWERLASEYDA
jgi:hypothetical protein